MCIGRGPAYDADDHGFKSNEIIAGKQADKAQELWAGSAATVSGEDPHLSWCSVEHLAAAGITKQAHGEQPSH